MGLGTLILADLAVSLFLAVIVCGAVVSVKPRILERFAFMVRRPGETLELRVTKASYHRPGERGLVAVCSGPPGNRTVTGRLFLSSVLATAAILFVLGLIPVLLLRA